MLLDKLRLANKNGIDSHLVHLDTCKHAVNSESNASVHELQPVKVKITEKYCNRHIDDTDS